MTTPKLRHLGPERAARALAKADDRIADINRLIAKLQKQVAQHRQTAALGYEWDDLGQIRQQLAILVGEEG